MSLFEMPAARFECRRAGFQGCVKKQNWQRKMKNEKLKTMSYLLIFVFFLLSGFILIHYVGFSKILAQHVSDPERFRDATFKIWDENPISKHGFLVFYSMQHFIDGVAYPSYSPFYLVFMYLFYCLENAFGFLPMRATVAYLEMAATLAVLIFISFKQWNLRGIRNVLLVAFSLLFLQSTPDFWISAGAFNVDNVFRFQMPLLILIANEISQGRHDSKLFWWTSAILALFIPLTALLVHGFCFVWLCFVEKIDRKGILKFGILLSLAGVLFVEPILVAKWLNYTINNSGWWFRSGLDGATPGFFNAVYAVLHPVYLRPLSLLGVPLFLAATQYLFLRRKSGDGHAQTLNGQLVFLLISSSYYIALLVLWPQAVSIHPYLYDWMMLAPIVSFFVLNFSAFGYSREVMFIYIVGLAFAIMFNLNALANFANCNCRYNGMSNPVLF
ncbi:hypothetical protein [Chitiniphilus shinanonensis]|uniref:hypothetical protein n=1 Tax=Chitiniphilus shinanonensis TaxID=553088 RepID=UPI0033417299